MPNKLKAAWQSGSATVNGWQAIPSSFAAEVYARAGFDSITIDLQHGVQDYHSCLACLQGLMPSGVVPMVRIPWNEPGIVGKVLDAGAYGIICPMVNSEAEARALVQFAKYPPVGTRSNGPVRAGIYADPGAYQQTANDEILVIPMIETRKAVENLESILDVPGIDAVYVGPSDLSFSLGKPPRMDVEDDEVLAIYERVLQQASKRGVAAGIHCNAPAYAKRMIKMGFRLVTVAPDVGTLLNAARAAVADTKAA
jgi:4-hydroxy-2-oxoheptanedioate aldolase